MAKTVAQWQQSIIDAKNANVTLAALNSPSKKAIWRLWTYIVGFCMQSLEALFEAAQIDMAAKIAADKTHTNGWYVAKAKAFQYTVLLPADTDVYPTIDETALIVTKAAAQEVTIGGITFLRIKVAKGTAPLAPLDTTPGTELDTFTTYMERIKDAGVRLQCTSAAGDILQLTLKIGYDPLVLDSSCQRLDGSDNTPVQNAIDAFLLNSGVNNFNGAIVLNQLIDAVLSVKGVTMLTITAATGTYGMVVTPFDDEYKPDAGYMVNDTAFMTANWTIAPHNPV